MQQIRTFLILLLSLIFLPFITADVKKYPAVAWTSIKNVTDPHVMQIAEFAVDENNVRSGENLELMAVVRGATQVVSGMNYRMVLKATDGTTAKLYMTFVFEKAWEGYKKLDYFEPLQG
ncbi:hypothetical protein HRI_002996100 [Hibiscus trionum]|uniref:Cystatin domain-containing protein n=1 Tax=Hibiscus trionum TaxID=183268 RepID=A0A9W7ID66_HIBTR|nr:hypothetical protein HRI_002996100 [Hibiscus trionum]